MIFSALKSGADLSFATFSSEFCPNIAAILTGKAKLNESDMQTITDGYRGMCLLFDLNWDRIMYLVTLIVALMVGGFIGSI